MSGRGGRGNGSSLKAIQDSAMEIYRNFVPALRRCSSFRHNAAGWMPGVAERKASRQQAENLMWQQDMFLRLINMKGLFQEGLIGESDVASFRQRILDHIDVCLDGGEFPQVTRDKLLFLQELLYARCISEEEYHAVKKSLLYRLAAEGAEINASDIVLSCSVTAASAPTSPVSARTKNAEPAAEDPREKLKEEAMQRVTKSKSPVKHLFEAMTRRKHSEKVRKVPHALDFVRPRDCPVRDPPEFDTSDQCGSPLFHSPSGSVSTMESSSRAVEACSKKNIPVAKLESSPQPAVSGEACSTIVNNGFVPTKENSSIAPASVVTCSKKAEFVSTVESSSKVDAPQETSHVKNDFTLSPKPSAAWSKKKSSFLSPIVSSKSPAAKKSGFMSPLASPKAPAAKKSGILSPLASPKASAAKKSGFLSPVVSPKAPAAKKGGFSSATENSPKTAESSSKRKSTKGASTDFYIDKVLGENIKKELGHIRSEINRTSSTQTFTTEQIDAIATRLPADKSELMRFFPKSWCDRYGDVVLDVVHKEFKGHVKDMEAARKNAKEKRRSENDENSGHCENGATTISKATSKPAAAAAQVTPIKNSKSSVNSRCFTTSDESSPRRSSAKKVTSFNAGVERYEKELDGKLCAEIEKLSLRQTPLRI